MSKTLTVNAISSICPIRAHDLRRSCKSPKQSQAANYETNPTSKKHTSSVVAKTANHGKAAHCETNPRPKTNTSILTLKPPPTQNYETNPFAQNDIALRLSL